MKERLNIHSEGLEKLDVRVVEAPEVLGVNLETQELVGKEKVTKLVFQAELNNEGEAERKMEVDEVIQPGVWGRIGKFVEKYKLELGVTAIAGTTIACSIAGQEVTEANLVAATVNAVCWPVVGWAFVKEGKPRQYVMGTLGVLGAAVGFGEPWTGVVTGLLAGVVGAGMVVIKGFGSK